MKRAVNRGEWVLAEEPGQIDAASEFQRKRLTKAVTAARVYLRGGILAKPMGQALGVTEERASQIVRLGIQYLLEAGWLRPAAAASSPTSSDPGPDRCHD
jgi:hypothetical protein